ncbi:hypothetical protein OAN307_c43980 [Octadecabacter antarcticus 307]|uniref:Uncharacterized protein n=1 Tax=Octadecabacter antarcticus 307 TaxID=391626 RepID=M9RH87_9RHOB|nr:hypothetical protein [Octadecabacter antarcticus]AGI69766.1 hypothetical protein OAN307_c43980 [Octadecabacter antarcticus 307]
MLHKFLLKFRSDEDGATTVDWVVLTAALVGLSAAVLSQVAAGSLDISDDVENCLDFDIPHFTMGGRGGNDRSYVEQLEKAAQWCSDGNH